MANLNQSTPLSNLINQLAPLIQQLQTTLTQSQAISHQPLTQNTPYRTPKILGKPLSNSYCPSSASTATTFSSFSASSLLTATNALESYDVPEDDPEVDLEDLIDGYLEVLDTWLPEPKNTCPSKIKKKEKGIGVKKAEEEEMDDSGKDDDRETIFDEMNKRIKYKMEEPVSDKEILNINNDRNRDKEIIKKSE
ncbi:9915_t:CDS:2, partial [Racocetra persica]